MLLLQKMYLAIVTDLSVLLLSALYKRNPEIGKAPFLIACLQNASINFETLIILTVLLVKGRNGKNLLMLNGYTYYQHKILRDGFRWSCTQMGSRSCRAFLHVTKAMLVVRAYTEHTHPPSTFSLKSTKEQVKIPDTKRHSGKEAINPLALKIPNVHSRTGF